MLLSLPRTWDASLFQVVYSLALVITFPLQLLPAFQYVERIEAVERFVRATHG